MYGYRYSPTGSVFPLPGLGLAEATAVVDARRSKQCECNNRATVELVEQLPDDGWAPVLAHRPGMPPQQAVVLPPDTGDVSRILAEIAALPRRSGRRRRR